MLNNNFYRGNSGGNSGKSKSSPPNKVGRVIKVLTDVSDPDCKNPLMLNGVYYSDPKVNQDEDVINPKQFAYQSNVAFGKLPLPGELVNLATTFSTTSATKPGVEKLIWTDIVNTWNHPYHGALPNTKQVNWASNLLGGVDEVPNINPLQQNPGDLTIQGRLGQSIRIGGYGTHPKVVGTSSKPVMLFRNGQIQTEDGINHIYEDINQDANSIYFVSDHKVPLIAANTKRASYNTVPITSNQYKGNQVLVNAGRLYFNAKEESILLSAKESIGLNAKTVNIDGQEYMCMDADKIYIGERARTATPSTAQPAVLGKELQDWMTQLLINLKLVGLAMQNASAVGAGPVTSLNMIGPALQTSIDGLINKMKQFQSNKIFIE